jgi:hypothetical protein
MTGRDRRTSWRSRLWAVAGVTLLLVHGGCGLEEVEIPDLEGPSGLGLGIRLTATPDIIVADGFSSSLVTAQLQDQNGRPLAGREIFFSVSDLGGNFADIGTLRSTGPDRGVGTGIVVRTDGSGAARVSYVAPPRTDMTANNAILIAARLVGEDARGEIYRTVTLELRSAEPRLFPPNPDNLLPHCHFVVEAPGGQCGLTTCTVLVNTSVLFQTTASDPDGVIVRYQWFFGDGTQSEYFPDLNHIFRTTGSFTVTHLVTDDSGGQAACQATITVR